MKSYDIFFILDHTEAIVLKLEEPLSQVHGCYPAMILFMQGKEQYLLANDRILCVQGHMQNFAYFLRESLNNNLQLHSSLQKIDNTYKDIGYFFCQHRQSKLDSVYIIKPGETFGTWVGYKYLLWGVKIAAWLYNDVDGNIIFEITPSFPGKPTDLEPGEPPTLEQIANSAWYEEWIKSYKPILIRKIPREIAQQWLQQAEDILKTIESNIARMQAEHKF